MKGVAGGHWTVETHRTLYPNILNKGLARFIVEHIRPRNFLEFGSGVADLANLVAESCDLTDSYCIEPQITDPVAHHRNLHLLNIDIFSGPAPSVLDAKFDLVLSIEVAEHIEREKHEFLFDFLGARAGRWVVFSGARPGQGGHGHVAERPEQEWREEFTSRGFLFDARMTGLARTLSDRKNINHRRNVQVFRAPADPFGLETLENRARPYLRDLLSIVQTHSKVLVGNLFYVTLQGAMGGRPEFSLRWKRENLMILARRAESILEIGFNGGHSALLCLLANPHSKIVAVDLPQPYTQACFDYLNAVFPGRLTLIPGDSREVLPKLQGQVFDLVHIDGGKEKTIADDLAALRRLVADDHMLVIDDTQNVRLDTVVAEHAQRGDIEFGAFATSTERSRRARWTHKLGRFTRPDEHLDGVLAKLGDIYNESTHASIYTTCNPQGALSGADRARALTDAVRTVEEAQLTGAFVEVGVAAGHSSVIAALAASRFLPRDFYLFDTFRGFQDLPDERDLNGKSIRDYDMTKYTDADCESGAVRSRMLRAGVAEDRLFLVEGPAEATAQSFAPDAIASLAC